MTERLRPIAALVVKDLRLFLGDRRAVILSFAAPLLLASLFASMTGGTSGPRAIAIAVEDRDQSEVSGAIVAGLKADETLDVSTEPIAKGRDMVRRGRLAVALAIPKGFGAEAARALFRAGEPPVLVLAHDPTQAAAFGMVRGLLTQQVMEAVTREAFSGAGGAEALKAARDRIDTDPEIPARLKTALRLMFGQIAQVQEQTRSLRQPSGAPAVDDGPGGGLGRPFATRDEAVVGAGGMDASAMAGHAFSGMAVQFILFASMEGGIALLLERQRGLWRRIRAAPLGRVALLGSKALSQALIALMILTVVYAFGVAVYGVRVASPVGFALVAVGYALTAATFGLLIAALGKTPQAARGMSALAVLLMVFLGGAWLPASLFPGWLRTLSLLVPTRWAVDGLEAATWRGEPLSALLAPAAALLGFTLVFGSLAAWRFRWEED